MGVMGCNEKLISQSPEIRQVTHGILRNDKVKWVVIL